MTSESQRNARIVGVDVGSVLAAMREREPVVHCIGSAAVLPFVASGLLAAGARSVFTESPAEAPAIAASADTLMVSPAALSSDATESLRPTVEAAVGRGRPWVLDGTTVGRVPVRTRLARRLVTLDPVVVRANPAETLALAGVGGELTDQPVCGAVHLREDVDFAEQAARSLADDARAVVTVTGRRDLVVRPAAGVGVGAVRQVRLNNGHPFLVRVPGAGVLLAALTAACATVAEPWAAAVTASTLVSLAAECAGPRALGPGTFVVHLLDQLYAVSPDDLRIVLRLA